MNETPSASQAPAPPSDTFHSVVTRVRHTFESGRTRTLQWRVAQLEALERMMLDNEQAIAEALHADLRKPSIEAYTAESGNVAAGVRHLRKKLHRYTKPRRVSTPMAVQPGRSYVVREPLGVVLVISPWNYPVQLSLLPVAGALAGGNTVVLKPSEISAATSELMATLIPRYLDPEAVHVVQGGASETTALLRERFDHIFYTGNGHVARIIMQAAVEHLTPVTLELGGKSPAIIDDTAELEVSARRLVWSKFYNAGQTCVAPDYALVHEAVYDRFVGLLKSTIREFFGERPQESKDLGRIVNARHHQRVCRLLEGQTILVGGETDEQDLYIAPTVLDSVDPESPVMQEEIFGPVLPLLRISSVEDAIPFINRRDKPLALYLYSSDRATQDYVLGATSSGAAVVNHGFLHMTVPGLPFGGVGESGIGSYHGKYSVDTFTHQKAVLRKTHRMDATILYPPYDEKKERWLRRLT